MKLYDIVVAYSATEQLAGIKGFTPAEQWIIYSFRKEAKTHYDFYSEQEQKIKNEYSVFTDENGYLPKDKTEEYIKALTELNNVEIEFEGNRELRLIDGIDFTLIEKLDKVFKFNI